MFSRMAFYNILIMTPQKYSSFSFDDTEIAFRLKSGFQLKRAELLFKTLGRKWVVQAGTCMLNMVRSVHGPYSWLVKPTVYSHFTGGETIEAARKTIEEMGRCGVKSILDFSIEGGETAAEFQTALEETLRTVENAKDNEYIPFAVFKPTAFIRNGLLEKAGGGGALGSQEEAEVEDFRGRVRTMCKAAYHAGISILVDAEDVAFQEVIDDVAVDNMREFNRDKAVVFNTYQMYRHDRLDRLKNDHRHAAENGYFLGAKLVRGAYLERERERALERGEASPLHIDKSSTDLDYNKALLFCIEHIDRISVFNGTHNELSCRYMADLMQQHNIAPDDERCYFSQLYGMRDNVSFNLADAGYNVAKYLPYGPLKAVLPYLIRRAEENSAIAGQMGRELELLYMERKRRKSL